MSWTYTVSAIATLPKDQVRFLVQDTDSTRPLVQDEEIDYALSKQSNIYLASAMVADSIARKYALQPNTKTDIFTEDYQDASSNYIKLAKQLRKDSVMYSASSFYSGGISKTDKQTREEDTDRVKPSFTVELGDNDDWY